MKKNLVIALMAVVMAFCFAACGGTGSASSSASPAADLEPIPITQETYDALAEEDWSGMSYEDLQKYFGAEGVVDEERTEAWGKDYLVVDWFNEDKTGYIHVLFKKDENGTFMPSSISPSF